MHTIVLCILLPLGAPLSRRDAPTVTPLNQTGGGPTPLSASTRLEMLKVVDVCWAQHRFLAAPQMLGIKGLSTPGLYYLVYRRPHEAQLVFTYNDSRPH